MEKKIPRVSRVAALAGCLFAGCVQTKISTRYGPLHPGNGQSVEFRLKAVDGDGIDKAELYVYEYELYVDPVSHMQSARHRAGGTWGLVQDWNYPAHPDSVSETFTVPGFPAASYITYMIQIRDADGNNRNERWTFAAGDWPFGNSPIPLWGNGAPGQRIDVCFVADSTDFGMARNMLPSLAGLIFDGYHTNNGVLTGKKYWQFYYSAQRGFISDYDTGPHILIVPASVAASGIIDHAAVIHTTVKRDWASGGNFGTEPTNRGTAVHESGHAAFGLSDEYAGGGHWASTDPHHNNYNSQASCQTYNTGNSWPAADCENIVGSWWRPEPAAQACIMHDDQDANMPDFERTCMGRINWFYSHLEDSP